MKILTLHCDYIRFRSLKKALKKVEDTPTEGEIEVKEPIVVMTAVEKGDKEETIAQLLEAVSKTARDVVADRIVLYPYAHLSSNLASPDVAIKILAKAEEMLREKGFEVTRAPFGYYKSFELKCKGHPLSELSKEFKPAEDATIEDDRPERLLKEISKSKLDTSKLKDNDHRILGQKLDLFSFNEVSPGAVFWHNNGYIIYKELIEYERELLREDGYEEISTPQILDSKLWKISGHWVHYREQMFLTGYEKGSFGIKTMNCPGAMLVYKTRTRSYKELPLRFAEFGVVHRKELSGVLSGLFRLNRFTQDDAHMFMTEKHLKSEIKNLLELMKKIYSKFELGYEVELSTRPEKFLGDRKSWDFAEKSLSSVLENMKIKYKVNKGEGAFYGPKIDVHVKDSLERKWQCATIQLDMQMPKRFEIKYKGEDNEEHIPLVVHRTILGAIERFIGILLEHTNGNLPLWLSPVQVRIINFTDRNNEAVRKLAKHLKKEMPFLRADIDLENTSVSDKIRKAELMKIPIMVVVGDKEEKSNTLAVRERGKKPKFGIETEKFVEEIRKKIEERS